MTANQIKYAEHKRQALADKEQARHNLATEYIQGRQAGASERQAGASERQAAAALQNAGTNALTYRESVRHNMADEGIRATSAQASALQAKTGASKAASEIALNEANKYRAEMQAEEAKTKASANLSKAYRDTQAGEKDQIENDAYYSFWGRGTDRATDIFGKLMNTTLGIIKLGYTASNN